MADPKNAAADPHRNQPIVTYGLPVQKARAAMVMMHGRGASPEDILSLAPEFDQSEYAYLAPQAAGFTWYPFSFLSPLAENEPGISSGLGVIGGLLEYLEAAGIPAERIVLLGFSQGACLVLEYAARFSRRFGGVAGLSGGLIGPNGTPRAYSGSLEGTPIFLGCSDVDPHVPKARVQESRRVLQEMGGEVTMRLYEGMGHQVNQDEVEFVRGLMGEILA